MTNVVLSAISHIDRFLQQVGLRSQRRYAGLVYDAVTKQPIDPAVVKLIHVDEPGLPTEDCVTDIRGSFGFVVQPGRYKLLVRASGYTFPSDRIRGFHDGLFRYLYHGELFTVTQGSDVVAFSVPLDPIGANWNQAAKVDYFKLFPYRDMLVRGLVRTTFWFGLAFSVATMVIWRSPVALGVLCAYGLCILAAGVVPHIRLWGRVRFKRYRDAAFGYQVRLSRPTMPDMVIFRSTVGPDGKFFLRVPKGRYLARVFSPAGELKYERPVTVRYESVLNADLYI